MLKTVNKLCLIFFYSLIPFYLNSFEVLIETEATKNIGYGECNMEKNGELTLMQKILAPNQIVIDAGANTGEWSLSALNIEPIISLTAFEPIPEIYHVLASKLFYFSQAKPINSALSNTIGKEYFHYYNETERHSALSGFYYREILKGLYQDPTIIEVELDTLTNFCVTNNIYHIDFLKIDTEGAEWKILKGAEDLIIHHKISVIQFEYGGCYIDAQTSLQQVYTFLIENDYLVFRIIPNGLVHISQWDNSLENFTYSNYCAVNRKDFSKFFPTHFSKTSQRKDSIRYGNF